MTRNGLHFYFWHVGGNWHHFASVPHATIVPSVQNEGAGWESKGQSVLAVSSLHWPWYKYLANLFAFIWHLLLKVCLMGGQGALIHWTWTSAQTGAYSIVHITGVWSSSSGMSLVGVSVTTTFEFPLRSVGSVSPVSVIPVSTKFCCHHNKSLILMTVGLSGFALAKNAIPKRRTIMIQRILCFISWGIK